KGELIIKDESGKVTFAIDGDGNARLGRGVGSVRFLSQQKVILIAGPGFSAEGPIVPLLVEPPAIFRFESETAVLDIGGLQKDGSIRVFDKTGKPVFRFVAQSSVLDIGGPGNEGDIRIRDDNDE